MSSRNNDEVNGMIFAIALIGAVIVFMAAVVYALAAFAAIVLTRFALAAWNEPLTLGGKGAWRDNVLVERLWRSVKYEEVYLRAYDSVSEARASIARYFAFYNERRPHSALDRRTPSEAYFGSQTYAPAA